MFVHPMIYIFALVILYVCQHKDLHFSTRGIALVDMFIYALKRRFIFLHKWNYMCEPVDFPSAHV
jgi:hypothetical protein